MAFGTQLHPSCSPSLEALFVQNVLLPEADRAKTLTRKAVKVRLYLDVQEGEIGLGIPICKCNIMGLMEANSAIL